MWFICCTDYSKAFNLILSQRRHFCSDPLWLLSSYILQFILNFNFKSIEKDPMYGFSWYNKGTHLSTKLKCYILSSITNPIKQKYLKELVSFCFPPYINLEYSAYNYKVAKCYIVFYVICMLPDFKFFESITFMLLTKQKINSIKGTFHTKFFYKTFSTPKLLRAPG